MVSSRTSRSQSKRRTTLKFCEKRHPRHSSTRDHLVFCTRVQWQAVLVHGCGMCVGFHDIPCCTSLTIRLDLKHGCGSGLNQPKRPKRSLQLARSSKWSFLCASTCPSVTTILSTPGDTTIPGSSTLTRGNYIAPTGRQQPTTWKTARPPR